MLDKESIIHVRGTPASGKTTLATLLYRYYKARGDRAVILYGWQAVGSAFSHLTRECEISGYPGIEIGMNVGFDIIFIIDEAQDTYGLIDLWFLIKSRSNGGCGPKFCLFSSYGSPRTGMVTRTEFTPPFLNSAKRVSMICSLVESSPDICLFYNKVEFEDVVRRYCMDPTTRLNLDEAAQTYLFSITNGHPGAVQAILYYIFKVFINPSFRVGARLITIDIWIFK
jgi:hypothetical protein